MADNFVPWDFEGNYQRRQTEMSNLYAERQKNAAALQQMQQGQQERAGLASLYQDKAFREGDTDQKNQKILDMVLKYGDIDTYSSLSTSMQAGREKRALEQKNIVETEQKRAEGGYRLARALEDDGTDDGLAELRATVAPKDLRFLPQSMNEPGAKAKLHVYAAHGETVAQQNTRDKQLADIQAKVANEQLARLKEDRLAAAAKQSGEAKSAIRAEHLRGEATKERAPIADMQQKIDKVRTLLASDDPADTPQITTLLTNMFDKTRATNLLFVKNSNFGTLAERVAGFFAKGATGKYSMEQRKQLRRMMDDMETKVIGPTTDRLERKYRGMAAAEGVPKEMVDFSDIFAEGETAAAPASDVDAQADKFLSGGE